MHRTTLRRLIAGIAAAAAASTVLLFVPTAAEAGHTLAGGKAAHTQGHTLG